MPQRERPIFTYQTRLNLTGEQADALDAYGELYGQAERALFHAYQEDKATTNELKREFLRRFGLTARQFNAVRVGLDGKIASIEKRRPQLIAEMRDRIHKAERVVAKLEKKAPGANKLHLKKRRLGALRQKLAALQADEDKGVVRLCFGGRRLFRAQFDLEANGFDGHEAWRRAWRQTRSGQFMVLGSGDETAGCQGCRAVEEADGSLCLHLRLPNAAAEYGAHVVLGGVRFAYGQQNIVAALKSGQRIEATTKAGKPIVKRIGTALTWRFARDDKGWRVFVSVEVPQPCVASRRDNGAIGVDVNADHLAVTEIDCSGNVVRVKRIDLPVYGKTTNQAKAIIGDAVVAVAEMGRETKKPVVVEKLDFQKKKAQLEGVDPRQARMLSSFVCAKMAGGLKAACFRAGVELIEVSPVLTSVIGAVNHARRLGISVHLGAAAAVARRGLGRSERPAVRIGIVPTRNGGHVTFALPVRNRAKHVWSFWSEVRRRSAAAHAAHFRCGGHKRPPPPLPPSSPAVCAIRTSTAQFRGANRSQNCSESVLDDVIPW